MFALIVGGGMTICMGGQSVFARQLKPHLVGEKMVYYLFDH
jgi:hypothetical protein